MCNYAQRGLAGCREAVEKIIVHLSLIAVFLSRFSLSSALPLADEEAEVSDREVPCRKKGRPKKKKDAKKKDKEGKPVKAKKRKKIVSLLSCHACLRAAFVVFQHLPHTLSLISPLQDSDVERDSDRERDYGENSDSVASDYGSGEKKKKKKHKERKEKKTKKKKKDDGDRDSSQEETTKVKNV